MKSSIHPRNPGTTRKADFSLQQPRVTKLTPEMCQAIRRQELGIDYWKTGFNATNTAVAAVERKPSGNKLSHINLNFQGAFLPNVVSGNAGVGSNGTNTRIKPRNAGNSGFVFNRSRTSLASGGSGIRPSETEVVRPGQRKATITDLTCLQLADTLFSTRKSPFTAGLFNLVSTKGRVSDFDDKGSDDDSVSDISDKSWPKASKRTYEVDKRYPKTLSALKYHTIQPGDCPDVRQFLCSSPDNREKPTSKPHKSILKNSYLKPADDGTDGTIDCDRVSHVPSSYRLSPKSEAVKQTDENNISIEIIRPKASRSRRIVNDLPPNRPLGSGYNLSGLVKDLSVRKRSVRFNSSHEIREYTPHDPVYNC